MGKVQSKGLSEYFQFHARNNYLITMGILRFYSYGQKGWQDCHPSDSNTKVVFLCSYLLVYKVCKPQANFSRP